MLTLAETAETLTVHTPIWIGALAFVVAAACGAYVVRAAKLRTKLNARIAGAGIATLVAGCIGWTLASSSTTLVRSGVITDGPFGEEIRAPWSLVRSFETDERPSLRGKARFLVLQVEGGDEVQVPLSGLSDEEAAKVIDFVKARTKR